MKYYKAKEFVKNEQKKEQSSYMISKHVMNTAYYAIKHGLNGEEFDRYIDSVIKDTHKKLSSCGCQCSIDSPLGKRISKFEGGGDWIKYAESAFRQCVKAYYEDLYLYNQDE